MNRVRGFGLLVRVQDRVCALVGCDVERRGGVVAAMLRRDAAETTSYWLQLLVAAGIATLGLVLGSAAVVIAGMLVAPLIAPIVNFGMGLAIGSPLLVLRSGARIVGSIVVALATSALITVLLPFHELNRELTSRAAPTALDLLVAAFCAIAGVFAALPSTSERASAAAGTSIGISLVPPLCACGYGAGTGNRTLAAGAGLLFTANLAAIILVATGSFLGLGFGRVPIAALEAAELEGVGPAALARRVARWLSHLFFTPGGKWLRVLMPVALAGAVYLPLRRALEEVAWEVRAKRAAQQAVDELGPRVLESRIRVEAGSIDVRVFVLGDIASTASARDHVEAELREVSRTALHVDVVAVADGSALAAMRGAREQRAHDPPTIIDTSSAEQLDRISAAVRAAWPEASVGRPRRVLVELIAGGAVRIEVVYLGDRMPDKAHEAIERGISLGLARGITLRTTPIPFVVEPDGDDARFMSALSDAVSASRAANDLFTCVTAPVLFEEEGTPSDAGASRTALDRFVDGVLRGLERVSYERGSGWRVRFSELPCERTGDDAGVDASGGDAGADAPP